MEQNTYNKIVEYYLKVREQGLEKPDKFIHDIVSSIYVSDYKNVDRPWKERLFTRPWRPWVKTKTIKEPQAYFMNNGVCIVSL